MAIDLVTGHAGTDHVSSASAGRYNAGVCGLEKYVLETGQQFAATIESANVIRIASGDAINQGRHITIPQNTYEDADILTGTQGKTRIDVIALRYTKTTQEVGGEVISVESASIAVIKGAEVASGSTPVAPAINDGDIFNGDVIDDMALYHVLITGLNISSVTPVFATLKNIGTINQMIGSENMGTAAPTVTGAIKELVTKIGSTAMGATAATITGAINEIITNIGNTAMGTTATTLTGAIKELVTKIGSTAMGTTATTITGAIRELKTAITTLQTSLSTLQTHDGNQGIFYKNVTLGTFYFTSSGAIEATVSVAGHIPSGYSLQAVIPRNSGTYAAYFYSCAVASGTTIYIQLMRAANYYTSVTQCSPTVTIVCKRNL